MWTFGLLDWFPMVFVLKEFWFSQLSLIVDLNYPCSHAYFMQALFLFSESGVWCLS